MDEWITWLVMTDKIHLLDVSQGGLEFGQEERTRKQEKKGPPNCNLFATTNQQHLGQSESGNARVLGACGDIPGNTWLS